MTVRSVQRPLTLGSKRFSFAAPIPPLTFLSGQARIARLSHGSVEHIENTRVLMRASEAFQAGIEFARVLFRELRNRTNTEKVEIVFDGRADGNKVTKLALCGHGGIPFISLYFRHDHPLYRRFERLQSGK